MGSLTWEQKKTFVTSLIEKDDFAGRALSRASESEVGVFPKQNTFSYYLKSAGGQRKKVCRNFFLSTTGLSRWCVRDRIMNERPTRKADTKFCVDELFNLLLRLPSHYCRASSSKLYLEPFFQSFADIYSLYLTKCKESNWRPLSRNNRRARLVDAWRTERRCPKRKICRQRQGDHLIKQRW